jgi:hypothetical protein
MEHWSETHRSWSKGRLNCSEGVGRQVLVVVREPVGIAVGMGSEHEQKTQYLQRELKPVDHRVGMISEPSASIARA